MEAAKIIETERLILRKPEAGDADAIFSRYANDEQVTRYLSWPRHESLKQTREFLARSDAQWQQWPAGPYLIFLRADDELLGSTGLQFENRQQASLGYVLARDAWGKGFASESVGAMVQLAEKLRVVRLLAECLSEHLASRRVLEKAGFKLQGTRCCDDEFPNLEAGVMQDVVCYALLLPT